MADIQIPREAVDKAAQALAYGEWDKSSPLLKHKLREHAMTMLNAAAPHIVAAELDRIVKSFADSVNELCAGDDVISGPVVETYFDEAKKLRTRLVALRAQA